MKLLSAICVCFFISCSPFGLNPMGYESPCLSLDEAWKEVSSYEGIEDCEPSDSFKSPLQFVNDGGGDCEDFSIYMVYLLGEDASMVVVNMYGGKHAIVFYDGFYIEPQVYGLYYKNVEIIKTYSYDYIMSLSTRFGSRCY